MKRAVNSISLTAPGGPALRVTASMGIATLRPADPSPQALVERADAALYETKARGRDGLTREEGDGFVKVDDSPV